MRQCSRIDAQFENIFGAPQRGQRRNTDLESIVKREAEGSRIPESLQLAATFQSSAVVRYGGVVSHQRDITDRMDYEARGLDIANTLAEPVAQFDRWFSEAIAANVVEPNAMVLSTVAPNGNPSSRAVLLKAFSGDGFVFYTNLGSAKARDIAANPVVSLLFLWLPLHRQVRITGLAQAVDDDTADAYFDSRPREARIGAIASPQSSVIESRDWLELRISEIARDERISRPEHWGGYRVQPQGFEFWQGRPDRLHDRIRYLPAGDSWERARLAP